MNFISTISTTTISEWKFWLEIFNVAHYTNAFDKKVKPTSYSRFRSALGVVSLIFWKISQKKNSKWWQFPFRFSTYELSFPFYRFLRWSQRGFPDEAQSFRMKRPLTSTASSVKLEYRYSRYILIPAAHSSTSRKLYARSQTRRHICASREELS